RSTRPSRTRWPGSSKAARLPRARPKRCARRAQHGLDLRRATARRVAVVLRTAARASLRDAAFLRPVERDRRAEEALQRRCVDLLAFAEVDRAPHVALEAGIEE